MPFFGSSDRKWSSWNANCGNWRLGWFIAGFLLEGLGVWTVWDKFNSDTADVYWSWGIHELGFGFQMGSHRCFLRCLSFEMCLFWEDNSRRIPNMSSDWDFWFISYPLYFTERTSSSWWYPDLHGMLQHFEVLSFAIFKLCQDTGKIVTSTQSALRLSGWCFLKAGEFRSKIPKFLWLLRLAQDVWSREVRTEGAKVKSSKLTKWWWVEKFVVFFLQSFNIQYCIYNSVGNK